MFNTSQPNSEECKNPTDAAKHHNICQHLSYAMRSVAIPIGQRTLNCFEVFHAFIEVGGVPFHMSDGDPATVQKQRKRFSDERSERTGRLLVAQTFQRGVRAAEAIRRQSIAILQTDQFGIDANLEEGLRHGVDVRKYLVSLQHVAALEQFV